MTCTVQVEAGAEDSENTGKYREVCRRRQENIRKYSQSTEAKRSCYLHAEGAEREKNIKEYSNMNTQGTYKRTQRT